MLHLPDVLTAEELSFVRDELTTAAFADGKSTAQGIARDAKRNEQLNRQETKTQELDAVLLTALCRHPLFDAWAMPKSISAPLVNRHAQGMHYGFHTDLAITKPPGVMRRDISVTLFLDDPESYDGGELEVESPGGLKQAKLPAGHAFMYTTNALHQVREVTRGVRRAAVFWIQSTIPDDAIRHTIFDLHATIVSLQERGITGQELLILGKVHQNLCRKFARP